MQVQTTLDTLTGKNYLYNAHVVLREEDGSRVKTVARKSNDGYTYLHPTRLQPEVLAALNPELDVAEYLSDLRATAAAPTSAR